MRLIQNVGEREQERVIVRAREKERERRERFDQEDEIDKNV